MAVEVTKAVLVPEVAAPTEAEDSKGVASFRRPETLPRCLHSLRCQECLGVQTLLAELCTEARELRTQHEALVARCIENNLVSPELRDATLQTALQNNPPKGESGVM